MSSSCLGERELTAFLAGEASSAEEARIAEHLHACPTCEQLAGQLADDEEVRSLRAGQGVHGAIAVEEPSLVELRAQLHALGSVASANFQPPAGDDSERRGKSDTFTGLLAAPLPAEPGAAPARQKLGPFEIVRLLGSGAFGVVYLAHDQRLGRDVALKLPRSSVLADPDLKARFHREAQALARLDHPHIVPVFEAGEYDGTCYLAVAFCDGPTLAEWLHKEGGQVAPHLAARIVLPLTDAVAHAHARQILHRDIKPGNVLLDKAAAGGELAFAPRLTDFGLAKIAERPAEATLSGTVLGTPHYMAPEQAAGHQERIGPATDVYSLGAVLYELLAGKPPIVGSSPVDTLRRVLIDEPQPIRRQRPAVPEDLEAIVLKCLDKSPARRYAQAAELAGDLRRFLAGKPTLARPLGLVERTSRWVSRHPALTAVAALALLVVALAAGLYAYDRRLTDIRADAAAAEVKSSQLAEQVQSSDRHLEELAYVNDIRAAARAAQDMDLSQAALLLKRHLPAKGKTDLRGIEWHYLWALTHHETFAEADLKTDAYQLRLSPDGQQLAAACKDGVVRLLDPATLAQRGQIATGQGEVNGVAFDPSGQLLATAGDDGTVKVWRLVDRQQIAEMQAAPSHAYNAIFVEEGRSLAVCSRDKFVRLFDLKSQNEIAVLEGHEAAVEALALSPDGRHLASASSDKACIVWDLARREQAYRYDVHNGRLSCVAFSPDGQILATGGLDSRILARDYLAQRWLSQGIFLDGVQSVVFSGDGQRVIGGDRGGAIRNWRLAPRDPPDQVVDLKLDTADDSWQAHEGRVWSLCALPDGERFFSSGADGKVRGWGPGQLQQVRRATANDPWEESPALALSADGRTIFVARAWRGIEALDAATGKSLYFLTAPGSQWNCLALLEDRRWLMAGNWSSQIVVWDLDTREPIRAWSLGSSGGVNDLLLCHSAGLIAARALEHDDVRLLDLETGRLVATLPAESNNAIALSPDGRLLAYDTLNRIGVYDLQSRQEAALFTAHSSTITTLEFSPDGRMLASGSKDRTIKLWTPKGQLVGNLGGHRHELQRLAFTPDGKSLVSGDRSGQVRITNVTTQRELLEFQGSRWSIRDIQIFPDSRRLALIGIDYELVTLGPAEAQP